MAVKYVILTIVAAVFLVLALIEQGLPWYITSRNAEYTRELTGAGWIKDEVEWRNRRDRLEQATRIARLEEKMYWQLGEMHRMRAAGMSLWPERRERVLREAKEYYIDALSRSPHDGDLISRVSHSLALMGDPLAVPLITRAYDIGPYETTVRRNVNAIDKRLENGLKLDTAGSGY